MSIIETLSMYLEYPFVRSALIVGILIALCSSLLGVPLVLKRFSYIGDGLSHAAFGIMVVAGILHFSNTMYLTLPLTVLCAIFILCGNQNSKIKGDATIAMISTGSLALGYLLKNQFTTGPNVSGDVCSTLFGSTSILTLSSVDVILCIILSAFTIIFYIMFYNKIFAITFDETFAASSGVSTKTYNFAIACVTAVIIVLAMNLVGSLLISALIIFPALSAMRLFKTFRSVTLCSAIVSVLCALSGMLFSIIKGTPVGCTIVAADAITFFAFTLLGKITRRS